MVDRYSLYNGNCYIFTPAVLQIGDLRIGSDSQEFTVSDKKQDDFYVLTYTSTQGNVDFYPSDNLFQYHEVLSEERSDIVNITLHFFLKDVRPMLPLVMKHSTSVA